MDRRLLRYEVSIAAARTLYERLWQSEDSELVYMRLSGALLKLAGAFRLIRLGSSWSFYKDLGICYIFTIYSSRSSSSTLL